MKNLFPVGLLIVVFLAGCASSQPAADERRSYYYASSEAVFEAALDVIHDRTLSVQSLDRTTGTIHVARKSGLLGRSQSSVVVQVDEADGGLTRVGLQLQSRSAESVQLFRAIGWKLSEADVTHRPATAGRY